MRMKKVSRMLSLVLCCAMIFSSAACGKEEKEDTKNESENASNEDEKTDNENTAFDKVETLTYYNQLTSTDLSDLPWVQEMFEKKFGLKFEVKLHSAEADPASTMLASGELTDIWLDVREANGIVDEILENAEDFLLNLEDYKEYLPNIFENPLLAPMLEYMRTTYGGVYAVLNNIGSDEKMHLSPQIRYDVYKELGYPEIKDEYELLDILEQMLALEPETADGFKTYGLGYMGEWGQEYGIGMFGFGLYRGYYQVDGIFQVPYDDTESTEVQSFFDKESNLYNSVNWLFEANQRGLIDPDSKTGTYNDWAAKVANGQYMYMINGDAYGYGMNSDPEWGYEYVEFTDKDICYPMMYDSSLGSNRFMGLGVQLKDDEGKLEKALAYLNWIHDVDVIRLMCSGEEGKVWEINEKGQLQYTDALMEWRADESGTLENPYAVEGYADSDIRDLKRFLVEFPYKTSTKANDGYSISIERDSNYYNRIYEDSLMRQDYAERHDGYNTFYAYHSVKGDLNMYKIPEVSNMMTAASDEMALISETILNLVREAIPQMIFASDKAEFDNIYDSLCEDAESAGLPALTEDFLARYIESLSTLNSYK